MARVIARSDTDLDAIVFSDGRIQIHSRQNPLGGAFIDMDVDEAGDFAKRLALAVKSARKQQKGAT